MLKELGVFWMNYGDVIIAISAAITLIGVVFTLFKNNSISTKSVDRTAEAEKTLSTEHRLLLERTSDSKAILSSLQGAVAEVDKRLITSEADRRIHYASLSDAQKTLSSSAENIGKFAEEFSRLASDNAALKQEVQELRQQLEQQNEILRHQSHEPDEWEEVEW